jgi:hypothetical protein
MPRGPSPDPNARRRNKPTIASTDLPAAGREDRAPTIPKAYNLGKAGRLWWRWAWKLPQATQWDAGATYFIVRRAQLEDDLAALEHTQTEDLEEVLCELVGADGDQDRVRSALQDLDRGVQRLKALAGGRVGVMREMRELDNRLGLNPKAMADLRWKIAAPPQETDELDDEIVHMDDFRARVG